MSKRKIIFIIACCIIVIFTTVIVVLKHMQKVNTEDSVHSVALTQSISDAQIQSYLEQSNIALPHFNGAVFVTFQKLGEDVSTTQAREYVWLMTQEFYMKEGKLQKGISISTPAALYFDHQTPAAINMPRGGELYASDIQTIFPISVQQMPIFTDITVRNESLVTMRAALTREANIHFNISPEVATSTPAL